MKLYSRLALAGLLIALVVVPLGAYVRLSNAGLGCPDWPGCYGHVGVPTAAEHVDAANQAYPERPVEAPKAWKEMVHRYIAGGLGLVIFAMLLVALRRREQTPWKVTLALAGLVVFQALLGMWTVTLLLKPLIVLLHLLGGLAVTSLLWWCWLRTRSFASADAGAYPRQLAIAALLMVIVQISLGGWTSTNYAATACPDFPTCQNQWFPEMDAGEAFVLWRGLGIDYEGGVLENPARVAIHYVHRVGALLTLLVVGFAAFAGIRRGGEWLNVGWAIAALLAAQIAAGIALVKLGFPLWVATAHNAVAALLLLSVVLLVHLTFRKTLR